MRSLAAVFCLTLLAQSYPKPSGYVSDFAHVLTSAQVESLTADLSAFEKRTTIEIAVVTVTSLEGKSIESYTQGLATSWGVGKRGANNGIVLLLAPAQRQVRLQTAAGIRARLTDAQAETIRDRVLLPAFRAGDMAGGIVRGARAIMDTLDGLSSAPAPLEATPQPVSAAQPTRPPTDYTSWLLLLVGALGPMALVAILLRRTARQEVLSSAPDLRRRVSEVETLAANPDVQQTTRLEAAKEARTLSSTAGLTDGSRVSWWRTRNAMRASRRRLDWLEQTMREEIAYAARARREGPELLSKMPELIANAERAVAEGKNSKRSTALLDEARTEYARAQRMQAGGGAMDWVLMYAILESSRTNIDRAQTPEPATTSFVPDTSSSTSSTDAGASFGGGGGFDGGGGGGGSDGGGSSGSW